MAGRRTLSFQRRDAENVKRIYIEPPYNTGNASWAYNDNVNSPLIGDWLSKVVVEHIPVSDDNWLGIACLPLAHFAA